MKNFYPLRGLSNQRQLWSWISFDVANQSFTLLINTLLFSKYFTTVTLGNSPNSNTVWSLVFAGSMLAVVVLSPIVGAVADARATKKRWLIGTGIGCAALTCALGFIPATDLWIVAAIYIPANICFNLGENFLASFLPELAERGDFGRISGFSWACAYAAALLLLVLTVAGMFIFNLKAEAAWRPFFVFAGLWFLAFLIPTALILKEKATVTARSRVAVVEGLRRLASTARSIGEFRDLATLLIASLFYGTGMSVIIAFASIIAGDFGFAAEKLVGFVAVVTISGVIGTLVPTVFQDRLGHKRTTLMLLVLWMLVTGGFAAYAFGFQNAPDPAAYPRWPLWMFGNLIGVGLGSLGSANRAFVGFLTPEKRSAEVFGLWGMVFKLAAVGTVPFAIVKDRIGMHWSLIVLAAFFVMGFILTLFINENRGNKAAETVDRGV